MIFFFFGFLIHLTFSEAKELRKIREQNDVKGYRMKDVRGL